MNAGKCSRGVFTLFHQSEDRACRSLKQRELLLFLVSNSKGSLLVRFTIDRTFHFYIDGTSNEEMELGSGSFSLTHNITPN